MAYMGQTTEHCLSGSPGPMVTSGHPISRCWGTIAPVNAILPAVPEASVHSGLWQMMQSPPPHRGVERTCVPQGGLVSTNLVQDLVLDWIKEVGRGSHRERALPGQWKYLREPHAKYILSSLKF